MKRNVFIILMTMCFWAGISAEIYAQESEDYLYISAPDGQKKPFAIADIRKITFTGETMSVFQINGDTEQISYNDICKLTFEPQLTVDNKEIETNPDIKVYISGGMLFVKSQEELIAVSLYNMQGRQLQNITPRSVLAVLPLQNIPAGVCVVRILSGNGVHTYKIINY